MSYLPSKGQLLLPLLCLFAAPASAELRPYVSLDSFTYSQPVSIKAAVDNWQSDDYRSGKQQWTSQWLETGIHDDDWSLAYLYRADLDLRFNRNTSDYYYNSENDGVVADDTSENLWLYAHRFEARGIRVSKALNFKNDLRITVGFAAFSADELIEGSINGTPESLHLDYFYSEDTLLDRPVDRPDGRGASIDLNAQWTHQALTLNLTVKDLLGNIWWKQAPYTVADANADQDTYDDEGHLLVKPLLTGVEGTRSRYRQSLHPQIQLMGLHPVKSALVELGYYHRDQVNLWSAGHRFAAASGPWGYRYWPQLKAVELYKNWGRVEASLAVDTLDWEDTRALWLTLNVR